MKRPIIVALAAAVFASPALADGPLHIKRTLPVVTVDVPAGEGCDFAYHGEYVTSQNIKRFFDDAGTLVRVERTEEQRNLHQNVDTGLTLTEVDHFTFHYDAAAGEFVIAGNTWHLRDEDGRLVVVRSGRYVTDLFTGEIVRETPNAGADFGGAELCYALGGAPAP